jgi:isocitrate lyase
MNKGKQLRALMRDGKHHFTPGITTPLHAMICEKAGFEFIYMGGYDVSLTLLGLPDVGLITGQEMAANAGNIARAVGIPVIADADTGYGNAINVMRTVRDFENAGVAAIHIEDQISPKRCGHVAGKQVIPLEEAAGKIRAACDARRDPDFVIIARTDAVAAVGGGLDEAIRRAKAYAAAGADMIFPEFPNSDLAMPKRFAEEVHKEYPQLPLYFNYSSNLKWFESGATFDDVAAIGFNMMHVSLAGLRTSMQAMFDYAADLKKRGAVAEIEYEKKLLNHPMGSCNEFAGFPKIMALEEKYLPADELKKKYQQGGGH